MQISIPFILIVIVSLFSRADAAPPSEATLSTLKQSEVLNRETGHYGGYVGQSLVRCSQFQDLWLSYFLKVESAEEFHRGMELIYPHASSFRSSCNYACEVVNFFNPGGERFLSPQPGVLAIQENRNIWGFLNTFKTGRQLEEEEREALFAKEAQKYEEEAIVRPFTLTADTVKELSPETIYNFALLTDGTIRAALERPGEVRYYIKGEEAHEQPFTHPNHTILAGAPHQLLLAGGSFLFFEKEGRRLYYLSNKSGHFVPYFCSLRQMTHAMEKIGINRYTVLELPDLDIAAIALKLYNTVQMPISLETKELLPLYQRAYGRWQAALEGGEVELLELLAAGERSELNEGELQALTRWRDESTYMRAALQLFSSSHQAPQEFHQFVLRLGKLKDALRHRIAAKVQSEAQQVLALYRQEAFFPPSPDELDLCDEASFISYLNKNVSKAEELLNAEELPAKSFHALKKWSRELATLFMLLAEEFKLKDKGYSLNRAMSHELFRLNEKMGKLHDLCVRDDMMGEGRYDEMVVPLNEAFAGRFRTLLSRLRVAPLSFALKLPDDNCFWLINCAKEWYWNHYCISKHPDARNPDNYNPRAKELLEKIASGNFQGISSEDETIGLELLSEALRTAEYARSALIFIDRSHCIEEKHQRYIDCLQQLLEAVRQGNVEKVGDEAKSMLLFMQSRGSPIRQLENYVCTDQEGFNAVLKERLDALRHVADKERLTPSEAKELLENVTMLRDILELFRHAGVKYQSSPTVCYDLAKDAAEHLRDRLILCQREHSIAMTEEMRDDAHYLLKKLAL